MLHYSFFRNVKGLTGELLQTQAPPLLQSVSQPLLDPVVSLTPQLPLTAVQTQILTSTPIQTATR